MSHLATDTLCAYCGTRRGHQKDHLIKSNQARRNLNAAARRQDPRYIVRACSFCNEAIGTRLRVPPSKEHLIAELEELTGGKYAIYDGTAESLREVIR